MKAYIPLLLFFSLPIFLLAQPSNQLKIGQKLEVNQLLQSNNKKYYLQISSDCNAIIYTEEGKAIWSSSSQGKGEGCSLLMQNDGDLVLYNKMSSPIWSSQTNPEANPNYSKIKYKAVMAVLEDDGCLVLYSAQHHRVWDSKSGRFAF